MKKLFLTLILLNIVLILTACTGSSDSMSDDYQNNSNYRREINEMSQRTGESAEDIDRKIQDAVNNAGWDF